MMTRVWIIFNIKVFILSLFFFLSFSFLSLFFMNIIFFFYKYDTLFSQFSVSLLSFSF